MLWLESWNAWSDRLDDAVKMSQILNGLPHGGRERVSADENFVVPELQELNRELEAFGRRFASQLAPVVVQMISDFMGSYGAKIAAGGYPAMEGKGALFAVMLSGIKARINFAVSDREARIRRSVERSFAHLQSSIVVDVGVRERWCRAFVDEREEACEGLGAVQMLLHGIWAFKAHSEGRGGRTDLILGTDVNEDEAVRAADAMVLTEWKKVKRDSEAHDKAMQGFRQAQIYTSETLAGFELSSCRYIVLVSERRLAQLPEVPSPPGCKYEVRNIAVSPQTPSVSARAGVPAPPR